MCYSELTTQRRFGRALEANRYGALDKRCLKIAYSCGFWLGQSNMFIANLVFWQSDSPTSPVLAK